MVINGNKIIDSQTSSNLDDIEIKYFTEEELKELVTDYFNLYIENRYMDNHRRRKAILHGQELILTLSILVRNQVDSYFGDFNQKKMLYDKIDEVVSNGKDAQSIGEIDGIISDLNNIIKISTIINMKEAKHHIPSIFIKTDGKMCPEYIQDIVKKYKNKGE